MKTAMGGQNRTGLSRAPELGEEMMAATAEFPPSSAGTSQALADVRIAYARAAKPAGTMPPPASVGQLAKTALRTIAGGQPVLLLDKLGERAAFERAGTRLYDALISKHDAGLTFRGGPSRAELTHVRNEEHEHFLMLGDAIKELGGDPTVVTPSANIQTTASKGLCAVLADPRTNVLQCLEALLTAELVDNDCWPALIELAENDGLDELVQRFQHARENEQEHLRLVRTWIAAGHDRSAERATAAGAETARKPMRAVTQRPKSKRSTASASLKKRPRSRDQRRKVTKRAATRRS